VIGLGQLSELLLFLTAHVDCEVNSQFLGKNLGENQIFFKN